MYETAEKSTKQTAATVLDAELYAQLAARARRNERTIASEIRFLIRAAVNGDGSDAAEVVKDAAEGA